MGFGGPPIVVPTGTPATREAAGAQVRECRAGAHAIRERVLEIERRARTRSDVVLRETARGYADRAFALARLLDEDVARMDDRNAEPLPLERVGVDCDRVATLAKAYPEMIAIDCGCPSARRGE